MTPDLPELDDPILRRVAATRPRFPEALLDPSTPQARALRERAMGAAPPPRRSRRRLVVLSAAVVAVVIVGLVLTATLGGPEGTGTQPAAAAIVRHLERALADRPGTIVVERITSTMKQSHGPDFSDTSYSVSETFPGSSLGNGLEQFNHDPPTASDDGDEELYLPRTNTIYISNDFTPYLHPGRRPGTYLYRSAPGSATGPGGPIVLTQAQVQAIEHDEAVLSVYRRTNGSLGLQLIRTPRQPATEGAKIAQELSRHELRFDGRTRLRGVAAYRFVSVQKGTDFVTRLYVAALNDAPLEEVTQDGPGGPTLTAIWSEYRVLAITPDNQRLLSLRALHPTARVDRNRADFLRAQRES